MVLGGLGGVSDVFLLLLYVFLSCLMLNILVLGVPLENLWKILRKALKKQWKNMIKNLKITKTERWWKTRNASVTCMFTCFAVCLVCFGYALLCFCYALLWFSYVFLRFPYYPFVENICYLLTFCGFMRFVIFLWFLTNISKTMFYLCSAIFCY